MTADDQGEEVPRSGEDLFTPEKGDLMAVMCWESVRLQEAWIKRKPRVGDNTNKEEMGVITEVQFDRYGDKGEKLLIFIGDRWWYQKDLVWLPRQEDLQELYIQKCDIPTFACKFEIGYLDTHDKINDLLLEVMDNHKEVYESLKFSEIQTLGWLLFVHKELWNQTWSFEEKRWVDG